MVRRENVCQTHKKSSGEELCVGAFKKGFDARRHIPQNAGIYEFRLKLAEMLREKSLDAFSYLVEVLNDKNQHPKLRKECAVEILNRGLGAPVNTVMIEQLDGKEGADASTLSTKDLERIVLKLAPSNGHVIESKPVEKVINNTAPDAETGTKNSLKQSGV